MRRERERYYDLEEGAGEKLFNLLTGALAVVLFCMNTTPAFLVSS